MLGIKRIPSRILMQREMTPATFTVGQIFILRVCFCTCLQHYEQLLLKSSPLSDKQEASEQGRMLTGEWDGRSGERGGGGGTGFASTDTRGAGGHRLIKQRRVEVYDWGNFETTVSLLLIYAMSFVHKDFVGDGRGGKG